MLSGYLVEGALEIARRLAESYSGPNAIDRDLRHASTQGRWPAEQLDRARAVLVRAGLFDEDDRGRHQPGDVLRSIATLPDIEAIPELARLLETLLDDEPITESSTREEVGRLAEEHVVAQCRTELRSLGRDDLAGQVSRVSLISDRLGYDVSAPTLGTQLRHLEVKGSTRTTGALFTFFISRNEHDVGRKDPDWCLVACSVEAGRVEIIGHLPTAFPLELFLPDDRNGHWTEALVRLPRHLLATGLPTAVP